MPRSRGSSRSPATCVDAVRLGSRRSRGVIHEIAPGVAQNAIPTPRAPIRSVGSAVAFLPVARDGPPRAVEAAPADFVAGREGRSEERATPARRVIDDGE